MALYSRKDFWDERYRYSPDTSHEWYQSYKNLRHLLNPIHFAAQGNGVRAWQRRANTATNVPFPPREACRVLILGCGNSQFGEHMRLDGWTGPMVNVDFSEVVIEQMKERYSDAKYERQPPMEFICHDITTGLPYDDESFDLIVCKGSFDAILCSAGSVVNIHKLVEESVRCLVRGYGVLFLVTHGSPDNRLVFLEYHNDINYYWDGVSVHTVERPISGVLDYVYICRRRLEQTEPLPDGNPFSRALEASSKVDSGKENEMNGTGRERSDLSTKN